MKLKMTPSEVILMKFTYICPIIIRSICFILLHTSQFLTTILLFIKDITEKIFFPEEEILHYNTIYQNFVILYSEHEKFNT
jgi:hypothetical protein